MAKEKSKICRSFRQDFPEFVARAEALGVSISIQGGRRNGHDRVFWLDGYRQLTGYTTRSDGRRFTHADAVDNIEKVLAGIEQDRETISKMSVYDRFARLMEKTRSMKTRHRMIGTVQFPCGDSVHCCFNASYYGAAHLEGIGEVARAEAEWRHEQATEQFARFCAALEADFAARTNTQQDAEAAA